jgi:hypothetical protein
MAKEIPSVGDLRRNSGMTDAEIQAATDAYLKDEGAPPFVFKSVHTVDVTTPGLRRTMVMTAVIMGFLVQG